MHPIQPFLTNKKQFYLKNKNTNVTNSPEYPNCDFKRPTHKIARSPGTNWIFSVKRPVGIFTVISLQAWPVARVKYSRCNWQVLDFGVGRYKWVLNSSFLHKYPQTNSTRNQCKVEGYSSVWDSLQALVDARGGHLSIFGIRVCIALTTPFFNLFCRSLDPLF